jgi:hypothetical protein
MSYYIFEKDLTSKHVSYHYGFSKSEKIHFNKKSKIKTSYDYVYNFLNELEKNNIFCDFNMVITPQNTFINTSYFHFLKGPNDKCDYKDINKIFGLNTEHEYIYFTKIIDDLGKFSKFKCGFSSNQFNDIDHQMKNFVLSFLEDFNLKELGLDENLIVYSFDFDENGNIIHDNINIEISYQNSFESFLKIKQKLIHFFDNINKDVFDQYENSFKKLQISHFKIKFYKNNVPTIKLYRTYNRN